MSQEIVSPIPPLTPNSVKPPADTPVKCGRCNQPKHKGGCRGVTKARHSKAWRATR